MPKASNRAAVAKPKVGRAATATLGRTFEVVLPAPRHDGIAMNAFSIEETWGGLRFLFAYWSGRPLPANHVRMIDVPADAVLRTLRSIHPGFEGTYSLYLGDGGPNGMTRPFDVLELMEGLPKESIQFVVTSSNIIGLTVNPAGASIHCGWIDPTALARVHARATQVVAEEGQRFTMAPATLAHFVVAFKAAAERLLGRAATEYPSLIETHGLGAKDVAPVVAGVVGGEKIE